jgi:phenylpyruvate tautomerase PptA (4-oxalocrotonate tautomerase family)
MPMIDVYAPEGAFEDKHELARRLAAELMAIEGIPDIAMFRQNTAACIHELAADAISNVDGGSDYVRVQVLTNAGGLDRDKQIAVVSRLTDLIAGAPGNPPAPERIWVLLTEATDGGWGLWGHAQTNAELVAAARREIAEAMQSSSAGKE